VSPKVCAVLCCGSTAEVETHHLYSVKDGCPDHLKIWLCRVCHEQTHGMLSQRIALDHRRLMMEGIAQGQGGWEIQGKADWHRRGQDPEAACHDAADRDRQEARHRQEQRLPFARRPAALIWASPGRDHVALPRGR
jgi:hypothetical protein